MIRLRHRGCVSDPLVVSWWREWRQGNRQRPFAEYVAARWESLSPQTVIVVQTSADPWLSGACGHRHPNGASCNMWLDT